MSQVNGEPKARGLYFPTGEAILSTPTESQIRSLSSNPRIEYFSTLGPNPVFADPQLRRYSAFESIAREQFTKYTLQPLTRRIRDHFANFPVTGMNGQILVRGTACSIDTTISCESLDTLDVLQGNPSEVRSIDQILEDGVDIVRLRKAPDGSDKAMTMITPSDFDWPDDKFLGFGIDYLPVYPRKLRDRLRLNQLPEDSVFPLVLIYNPNFVRYAEGLWIMVPDDPAERSQAIQRAYVLDYPHNMPSTT